VFVHRCLCTRACARCSALAPEQPGIGRFDVGVLLAGMGQGLVDGGEAIFDSRLSGLPIGNNPLKGCGGLTAPRALEGVELPLEASDFGLNAPDGCAHRSCRCEDCFAVYLESSHGGNGRGAERHTRARGYGLGLTALTSGS
jgi:hypothetical protein